MIKEIVVDEDFIERMKEFRKVPEGKSTIEACRDSLTIFVEKMLGMELYSWQVFAMQKIQAAIFARKEGYVQIRAQGKDVSVTVDGAEFVIITSRQIGKSTLIAMLCLWIATFNHLPCDKGYDSKVGVVSASDEQAKKLLGDIKKYIYLGDAHMNEVAGKESFFSNLLDEKGDNNASTITFKKHDSDIHGSELLSGSKLGSSIKSYPATSKVLGETFSLVIVDEAGKTDKITDTFYDEYLYPTGNSTHAIRINTSTPWVTSGFFYRLVDPDNMYPTDDKLTKYIFTIDAIRLENPNYYKTVMDKVRKMNNEGKTGEVQRAYYCRFVKGETSFFDPDKVKEAFDDYAMYEKYDEPCDMGVDFGGKTTSKSVITISKMDEETGKVMRLYHKVYPVGEDDTIIDDIRYLMKSFNIQRIIPDDCAQGDYIIREMRDLGWDVQPMNFRRDKVKKYGAFRSKLNEGKIVSYDDEDLRTEMLALENSQGSTQSKIQHAPGYTDDLIDSFLMSCYFYVQEDGGFKMFSLYDDDY